MNNNKMKIKENGSMNYLLNLLITLMSAAFSSRSRWFSVLRTSSCCKIGEIGIRTTTIIIMGCTFRKKKTRKKNHMWVPQIEVKEKLLKTTKPI